METVLAAVFVIFLVLFSAFSLSDAIISGQETLQAAWTAMEARVANQAGTRLRIADAHTTDFGATLRISLVNEGETALSAFEAWDVIAEHEDALAHHIGWIPFAKLSMPASWSAEGIYMEAGSQERAPVAEAFNRGILDPGETLILRARLVTNVEPGTPVLTRITTDNGAGATAMFFGNFPPILEMNSGMTFATGAEVTITEAELHATDQDEADELVYTIETPPEHGTLSFDTTFTPADIAEGRLTYVHDGTPGADSFTFTVSDGKDTIGAYTFTLTASVPPTVVANGGLTLAAGETAAISAGALASSDPDDPAEQLIYTVVIPPTQGTLSHATFTQADVDSGSVTYTHIGTGSDQFQFTVSDGETTLLPMTFTLTVIAPEPEGGDS